MQDPDTPDRARKRAAKACLGCQSRKVRCDVVHRKSRCTNCVLDNRECVVKPRPSRYRKGGVAPSCIQQPVDLSPIAPQPECQQGDGIFITEPLSTMLAYQEGVSGESPTQDPSTPSAVNPSSGTSAPYGISQGETSPSVDPSMISMEGVPISEAPLDSGCWSNRLTSGTRRASSPEPISQSHVIYSHFPFLRLDISLLSEGDVQYLEAQGCFKVPGRQAADEFVREYFLHVHPGLPLFDESLFWDMYCRRGIPSQGGRSFLSLFVFQAMLFASCSFVSFSTISSLGFTSMRAARATYYRRAKLLFDFCGEENPVPNSQGALLLSYNATMRDKRRTNSIWLATAIQLAQAAGAHQFYLNPDRKPEVANELKRLWWCCIVRDRILPLGVRRQLHIPFVDDDMDKNALTEDDFADELTNSRVYGPETKRSLVRLFITLCELAVSLTDVITTVYTTGHSIGLHTTSVDGLEQTAARIRSCKGDLDSWFDKATIRFPTPAGIGSADESLVLYTNLMYIYYHSARLALYQFEAFILSIRSAGTGSDDELRRSRSQLEDATTRITDNLKELIQLKLGRFLPISIVAYAALPLVLHIIDVKLAKKPSQAAQKQGKLNIYMETMKDMELYDGIDDVWDLIRMAVEYAMADGSAASPSFCPSVSHPDLTRTLSPGASGPIQSAHDWGHVLLQQPVLYFRLTHTIDLSLAMGRYSEDPSLPLLSKSGYFPLPRLLLDGDYDRNSAILVDGMDKSNRDGTAETACLQFQESREPSNLSALTMQTHPDLQDSDDFDYEIFNLQIPAFLNDFDLLV